MNPTKTIVDQAEAALRLFFADTREGADLLLSMYGPLVEMRKTSADAADEVRYLVLQRFPVSEPPAVPGRDFLPAGTTGAHYYLIVRYAPPHGWIGTCACNWETTYSLQREGAVNNLAAHVLRETGLPAVRADGKQIVAEIVAGDFQEYLTVVCPACKAAVGELCKGRDSAQWSHINRRYLSGLPRAEVLTGEVTSPFGPCSGLAADKRENTCTRFAAEFVVWVDPVYGTTQRRLCTPCADLVPDAIERERLTHAPGGVPVERAKPANEPLPYLALPTCDGECIRQDPTDPCDSCETAANEAAAERAS